MSKEEKIYALQAYYINKYKELFWIILRVGGCIMQQQLCRLMNNNQTDTVANTALVKKLTEAKLIKTTTVGRNSLIILTYPVFQYFGINRTFQYTSLRMKRSAMIIEKYLRLGYYNRSLKELMDRIRKTAAISYLGTSENHLLLINKYIKILEEKGWNVDGLKKEEEILLQRFDYQIKCKLYENYPPLKLNKLQGQLDLYNLECQQVFLSGIKFNPLPNGKEKLQVFLDIYNVNEIFGKRLGKLIINAQRSIQCLFADYKNNNFPEIVIQVFSHLSYDKQCEDNLYDYLISEKEYLGNELLARNTIRLVFLDTKKTLFSNIDPTALV